MLFGILKGDQDRKRFSLMFQPRGHGTNDCLHLTIHSQGFNISGLLTAFIKVLSFAEANIASGI